MREIMEVLFDVIYLISVIFLGFKMIVGGRDKYTKMFGYMSVLLGIGDSFHLVPRMYSLLTIGLEANATALGFGKLITSITMTIFYVILYHIWQLRFNKVKEDTKSITITIYMLTLLRIVICLLPQNDWFNYNASVEWGIYRNIPFAIMGMIIIYIMCKEAKKHNDKDYKFMAVAIFLSFALYIPVVVWGTTIRILGMLMIPKTLAYVWIVLIGYKHFKSKIRL